MSRILLLNVRVTQNMHHMTYKMHTECHLNIRSNISSRKTKFSFSTLYDENNDFIVERRSASYFLIV